MKFTSMKFTTVTGVNNYINKMIDLTTQLRALKVEMFESFLLHFILNTLPLRYKPSKVSYNKHMDKWSINELLTMYDQKEARLILEMKESALIVTQGKKTIQAKGVYDGWFLVGNHHYKYPPSIRP
ncbi:hypothetical protein J1N35_038413 [Gossypium stocksii]|uniref:Uncharacterized protein n=1 Tax=Gossypium stocksii TaxID=47602 RepID=A0A9D3ZML7_9ROSI|nr:hypothetical protein J1N35_038413 [Gossypium stocksii]